MQAEDRRETAKRGWAVLGLLAIAAAGFSCMQPEQSADDFGTGKGSAVTGDDDDDDDDDGAQDEEDVASDDDEATAGDDQSAASDEDDGDDDESAGKASVQPSKPPADAGAGPSKVDAGKPAGSDAGGAGPAADAGGSGGPAADAAAPAAGGPAPTKLSFSVQTVTMRGRYSPKHVLAIWVVDAQGKFVKTLAKHALIRARYLTGWNAASAGNTVDAVTSATLGSHGARMVTWNLTNASKQPVPDGEYKIVMELTENDRTGVTATVPFTKGPAPVRLNPADQTNFTSMSLVLE